MAKATRSKKTAIPKKVSKPKKKAAPPKKSTRKRFAFDGDGPQVEGPPISIRGYDAAFNPETGKAMVRIVMVGNREKEVRDLAPADFAGLVSMLGLSGLAYNGQYVIVTK
jgi:hypothetical protein